MPRPLKIAASTAGFSCGLDAALAALAGAGFRDIDLIAIGGWDHVSVNALVERFEEEASRVEGLLRRHGQRAVAMNCAFEPFAHRRADPAANESRRLQADAVARLMCRLGVLRAAFYPGYRDEARPWEEVAEDSALSYQEILDAGRARGVEFLLEVHGGTPFETPAQAAWLARRLPQLRFAYDPTHFIHQGLSLESTTGLLPRAPHVHLRDAAPGVIHAPCGRGTLDFSRVLEALQAAGYEGWISLECLPMPEGDVLADYAALRQRLGG